MNATDLRIPGPTPLPPPVMRAMQREMIVPRGATFGSLYKDLLRQIRLVHNTQGDAFVFPGTGSAGWEIAIVNTLSPGDTVIAAINGNFGVRFAAVAEAFGLNVVRVEVEWGQGIGPDQLRPALQAHPDARAVLLVHNETSTGVTNQLAEIGPLVRAHGALLLVDSVSGAAAIPIEMDAWQVDLIASGSQKAWMCPPGLTIVTAGPRVWQAYDRSAFPRFFWDLKAAKESGDAGSTRTTAPLTLIYALKAACDMIEAEGLDALYERHRQMGQLVRDGLSDLGFRLLPAPEYVSDSVTAAYPPRGIEAPDIVEELRSQFGISIGTGQAHMRDRIIRIGHMGWVHEPELRRTLGAISTVLKGLGS